MKRTAVSSEPTLDLPPQDAIARHHQDDLDHIFRMWGGALSKPHTRIRNRKNIALKKGCCRLEEMRKYLMVHFLGSEYVKFPGG